MNIMDSGVVFQVLESNGYVFYDVGGTNVGIRFAVTCNGQFVVGGPKSTKQDVISLNCRPESAKGEVVRNDRFQVLGDHRRQGHGTRIFKALIMHYHEKGAAGFLCPCPSRVLFFFPALPRPRPSQAPP